MRKNINNFCVFFGVVFFLSCNVKEEKSLVLARVGEAELSMEEIKSTLDTDSLYAAAELEGFIYRWVDHELLYQAALAEGIGSSPEIQEELVKVRRALIINKYLDQRLGVLPEISEERLKKYYSENQQEFIRDEAEYRYFYVICKDRSFGQQVLREVRTDVPFEEIISKNYPDKALNSIWDSGSIPLERVIPQIRKTIQNLRPGNSYGPVACSSGYIVFKLLEKYDEGSLREFDLVRDIIKARLQEEWYREQYQRLLSSLRTKKVIRVNFENQTKLDTTRANQVQK